MRKSAWLWLVLSPFWAACGGGSGFHPGPAADPAPPQGPAIVSFTASPGVIAAGGSSTLTWSVTGAASVSIDPAVGTVTGATSKSVAPSATTAYTLTATNAHGTTTRTTNVVVQGAGGADVTLAVDTGQDRRAISPYVYGYNAGAVADAPPGVTWLRIGGNRWTAYNWTNNYSNAGSDYGPYHNDTYLGSRSDGPGHPMGATIDDAKAHGIPALVTIPIQGWVSKDASGNVDPASPLSDHFVQNLPKKTGGPFTTTPSPDSSPVYQDELANFVAKRWGAGAAPEISLDNEPDLWSSTHAEVQRAPLTYADFLAQSVTSAGAIKGAAPAALVYGPVSYGWEGFVDLQGASDRPQDASIDNSFLDAYLTRMADDSATQGRRLLDVLDLHFYSEAHSHGCADANDDGIRVNFSNRYDPVPFAARNHDCVVAERVQAPRSLADPTYVETSWITQWSTSGSAFGQPIQLVPRMLMKIAAGYPGTKLAITEYDHGGGDHVSGAVAQADALGILGREGVYAASFWAELDDSSWVKAAWRAYRDYDGAGHSFGDTSVWAGTSDVAHVSVHASVDAAAPSGRVVLVIVHRPTLAGGSLDLRARNVQIQWTHPAALTHARAWQLASGASPSWAALPSPAVNGSSLALALPPLSVTTIELTP